MRNFIVYLVLIVILLSIMISRMKKTDTFVGKQEIGSLGGYKIYTGNMKSYILHNGTLKLTLNSSRNWIYGTWYLDDNYTIKIEPGGNDRIEAGIPKTNINVTITDHTDDTTYNEIGVSNNYEDLETPIQSNNASFAIKGNAYMLGNGSNGTTTCFKVNPVLGGGDNCPISKISSYVQETSDYVFDFAFLKTGTYKDSYIIGVDFIW